MTIWHNESYSNRVKLTIDGTKIQGDLTDFPVAIQLSDSAGLGNTDVSSIISDLATTSSGVDAYTEFLLQPTGDATERHALSPVCGVTFLESRDDHVVYGESSLYFYGSAASSVNITGNVDDFDFGTEDFTIDWWEYRSDATATRTVMCGAYNVAYCGFIVGYGADVYFTSNGSTWDITGGGAKTLGSIVTNQWSHLAVVRSGSTFYTFRDGVQQDTWSSSAAIYKDPSWYPMMVGYVDRTVAYAFYGYLQGLRVSKGIARWTTTFSGSLPDTYDDYEIDSYTKLLVHGDEHDFGSGSDIVIVYGAYYNLRYYPSIHPNDGLDYSNPGSSYYFNGQNDFIYSKDTNIGNFGNGDFTVDCWFKTVSYGATRRLVTNWTSGGSPYAGGWYLGIDGGTDAITFYWDYGSGLTQVYGATAIADNNWHHVAVVRSNDDWYIFLDGVLDWCGYYTDTIENSTQYLCVGKIYNANGSSFYGYISNVRISKGIARWTKDFTPPDQKYGSWNELVDDNRKKIAVYTEAGDQCYVEIEDWNWYLQRATLWAKVPTLTSGTDKDLYLYYNGTSENTTYVGDTGDSAAQNVWGSNYYGVWHLNENPQTGDLLDSTSTSRDATPTNMSSVLSEYSPTGRGIVLSANSEYGDFGSTNIGTSYSLTVLYKFNSAAGTPMFMATSNSNYGVVLGPTPGSNYFYASDNNEEMTFSYSSWDTDWHVATMTRDNTTVKVFVDGVQVGSTWTLSSNGAISPDNFGARYNSGNRSIDGVLSDIRLANYALSGPQVIAETNSYSDSLITYYAAEGQPVFYYSGTVQVQGLPVQRTVYLYNRQTGQLVGTATSDPITGEFIIPSIYNNYHFVVILPELLDGYDLIAHDKIHPEN
jgi:hypothetical protein